MDGSKQRSKAPSRSASTCGGGAIPTIDTAEVERLAALQFSVQEVAVILDITDEALASDPALARAYMRGRLQAQAEVRAAMLAAAKQGSPPAQKEFQKLAEESRPQMEE